MYSIVHLNRSTQCVLVYLWHYRTTTRVTVEKLIIPQRDSVSISSDFHFWQVQCWAAHLLSVHRSVYSGISYPYPMTCGLFYLAPLASALTRHHTITYICYFTWLKIVSCVYIPLFVDLLRHIWVVNLGLLWIILLSFCTSFCYTRQQAKREALF